MNLQGAIVKRRRYNVTLPRRAHPLVRELWGHIIERQEFMSEVCTRAGVSTRTVQNWRIHRSPTVPNLEAVLNAIGKKLVIVDLD